jgi:hypothetical protein
VVYFFIFFLFKKKKKKIFPLFEGVPCTVIRSDQVHLTNERRLSPFLKLSHSPIEEKEQRQGNPYYVDTWRNSGTAASRLLFLVLVHIAVSEVQALTKELVGFSNKELK